MTSDLPAGDVIVLHDDNGRHAYHALTLAMVALDALATDQSSRALGCAQGARYGCPKAAASSLEQIVWTKAPFFTHPKDLRANKVCRSRAASPLSSASSGGALAAALEESVMVVCWGLGGVEVVCVVRGHLDFKGAELGEDAPPEQHTSLQSRHAF